MIPTTLTASAGFHMVLLQANGGAEINRRNRQTFRSGYPWSIALNWPDFSDKSGSTKAITDRGTILSRDC
jgi:hypothetical protein